MFVRGLCHQSSDMQNGRASTKYDTDSSLDSSYLRLVAERFFLVPSNSPIRCLLSLVFMDQS